MGGNALPFAPTAKAEQVIAD